MLPSLELLKTTLQRSTSHDLRSSEDEEAHTPQEALVADGDRIVRGF